MVNKHLNAAPTRRSHSGNWLIAVVMAMATALSMASATERAMDLSAVEAAAAQKTGQLVAPWLPATEQTR